MPPGAESVHVHAAELGGHEVSELVNDDQEREREDADDPKHGPGI